MKKSILLLIKIISCSMYITPSFIQQISNKEEIALEAYKKINSREVSNKDANAYTTLIQLHVRTYDLYLAVDAGYSHEYISSKRQLLHDTITNAKTIKECTENENIFIALLYCLTFANEIINMQK